MGAESPLSFSEINEANHAEFISYSDVMRALMELTGKSLEEIAKGLKLFRIHKSHVAYLSGPELAVTKAENTDALEALLDETICSRRIASAHYGFEGEIAKPHLNGWLHREFIFAMARARLPWPVTPDMLVAVEERRAKQESESESPPNLQPVTNAEALAEIQHLKAEVQRLMQKLGETEKHALPTDDASKLTFEHWTSDLEILAEAAREWWSTYEPGNYATAPKSDGADGVVAWLEKKGVANRKAQIMASILRPAGIRPGPR